MKLEQITIIDLNGDKNIYIGDSCKNIKIESMKGRDFGNLYTDFDGNPMSMSEHLSYIRENTPIHKFIDKLENSFRLKLGDAIWYFDKQITIDITQEQVELTGGFRRETIIYQERKQ